MKQLYKKIGSYLILCIASVCFLLPFYLMICSASDGNISLSEGPVIPGTDLWENICYPVSHSVSEISWFYLTLHDYSDSAHFTYLRTGRICF